MTEVAINQLKKDDVIRFGESVTDYRVTRSEAFSSGLGLWEVHLRGVGGLDMVRADFGMKVVAVEMYRDVEVPCRAARHDGGPLKIRHNFATGRAPFAVICGRCDDEITAEVEALMQGPRRGDVVVMDGSAVKISAFRGETDVRLGNGVVIDASKLVSIGDRRWQYDEKRSND